METVEKLTDEQKAARVREYAAQANGTINYYRTGLGNLVYTDGVRVLAETCGAFWLIDLVSSWQRHVRRKQIRGRHGDFQLWHLTHEPQGAQDQRWAVRCWTDTPKAEQSVKLCAQIVPWSDFPKPLAGFKLYVEGGVLYLPEER